jgi:hypothetical protein
MKKLSKIVLAGVLSLFAVTSFNAAHACDGMKGHDKAGDNTQAKKDGKKTDESAKTDQKS